MRIEKITTEMIGSMAEFPLEPLETPALNVKRCLLAMAKAGAVADEGGEDEEYRRDLAVAAYKMYMPSLSDKLSIRANIACIAHGISIGIFNGQEGTKMLYAAQVALAMLRDEKKAAPQKARRNPKTRRGSAAPVQRRQP